MYITKRNIERGVMRKAISHKAEREKNTGRPGIGSWLQARGAAGSKRRPSQRATGFAGLFGIMKAQTDRIKAAGVAAAAAEAAKKAQKARRYFQKAREIRKIRPVDVLI